MGSTATSKAVKKTATKVKKDSGTKKSASKAAPKKAKSRATPVKKKTAVRKKAAAPKKATRKKTVGKKAAVKKKAPRKKAATKAGTTPNANNTTVTDAVQGDEKSLSWMAAQAASALKAVRANQNARAQDLLAKAEITSATPVKAHQEDKTRTESDAPEIKQDKQANTMPTTVKAEAKIPAKPDVPETKKDKKVDATPKPVEAVVKQVTKGPPAVVPAEQTAPDKPPPAQPAPVAPEPTRPETMKAAVSHATTAQPEVTENAVKIQHETPPAHVIAATSTAPGSRRSKRLFLLTGIIVLVGVLGARVWFTDNDTADIAAIQDSAETEQVSPVMAKPPIEAIYKVASEPTVKPATAATQTNNWSPTTHPAGPEPASTRETLPTVVATPPKTPADEVVVTETRQEQTTKQTAPAAPQVTSPVAPRPGYYAPAYGYYRQQQVRQQPYYRPAYSRPSYSQ